MVTPDRQGMDQRDAETKQNRPPTRRVVLLGASNLTRGCHTVLQTARQVWGGPLDLLAAWGRGRSFGWNSQFLGRTLPGIISCGLWNALDQRPKLPLAALVTDIGNDLLYGAEPQLIAQWVETCLVRLIDRDARITMTQLPMRNIETLSPRRFEFFRRLLFPGKPLDFSVIVDRAKQLDRMLRELAVQHQVTTVEQEVEWYGLDPIHVSMRHWKPVWKKIFFHWEPASERPLSVQRSLSRWVRLHLLAQEERRLFGRLQRRAQPSARFFGDVTLSLY